MNKYLKATTIIISSMTFIIFIYLLVIQILGSNSCPGFERIYCFFAEGLTLFFATLIFIWSLVLIRNNTYTGKYENFVYKKKFIIAQIMYILLTYIFPFFGFLILKKIKDVSTDYSFNLELISTGLFMFMVQFGYLTTILSVTVIIHSLLIKKKSTK